MTHSGFNETGVNVYTCRVCKGYTVTIDVDPGTTPFMLSCRASGKDGDCPGMAQSSLYPKGPVPIALGPPMWEWYKPSEEELSNVEMDPRMVDHARSGGLFLRKRRPQ